MYTFGMCSTSSSRGRRKLSKACFFCHEVHGMYLLERCCCLVRRGKERRCGVGTISSRGFRKRFPCQLSSTHCNEFNTSPSTVMISRTCVVVYSCTAVFFFFLNYPGCGISRNVSDHGQHAHEKYKTMDTRHIAHQMSHPTWQPAPARLPLVLPATLNRGLLGVGDGCACDVAAPARQHV